jgi:hypothetical protein
VSAAKRKKRRAQRLGKARLTEMVEEATVDAYGESEQRTAFNTLLDQHLETPFETKILGVTVTIERIAMTDDEQIIAICRRGRSLQEIPILDLRCRCPRPAGVEWIEAYRCWAAVG